MYIPKGKTKQTEDKKMWHEGTIGIPVTGTKESKIAHYWVKAYEEPSEEYGINGGKISKLSIKIDGEWVANYDRGWDIEPDPENQVVQVAYYILLEQYN